MELIFIEDGLFYKMMKMVFESRALHLYAGQVLYPCIPGLKILDGTVQMMFYRESHNTVAQSEHSLMLLLELTLSQWQWLLVEKVLWNLCLADLNQVSCFSFISEETGTDWLVHCDSGRCTVSERGGPHSQALDFSTAPHDSCHTTQTYSRINLFFFLYICTQWDLV